MLWGGGEWGRVGLRELDNMAGLLKEHEGCGQHVERFLRSARFYLREFGIL